MKNISKVISVILFTLIVQGVFAQSLAKHVIVISVDGLLPDFYLDKSYPAPTMQELASKGVYAERVRPVFPSVTYPNHVTIVTGAKPKNHGIYYNDMFKKEEKTAEWYWFEKYIQTQTIWEAAKAKGLATASISWPASAGADIDYNIPEIWSVKSNKSHLEILAEYSSPAGFIEEVNQNISNFYTIPNYRSKYKLRDVHVAQVASYIIKKTKPSLLTVHFVSTDHYQHHFGMHSQEAKKAVVTVDYAIDLIREAVKEAGMEDSTAIIITGDHGFVNVHTQLAPNYWLAKAGLLEDENHVKNWKAVFHIQSASAFLYLKDAKDKATLQRVRQILNDLPTDVKKLFRIIEKKELEAIGADPEVELAISPMEGIMLTHKIDKELSACFPPWVGTHGFYPDFDGIHTGFIGFGAGFKKGMNTKIIALEDIAPMVSHLLNLDMKVPDGTFLPGFFIK